MFKRVSNRKFRPRRKKKRSAWKRFLMVLMFLFLAKVVYTVWSTDGKVLESLWFRFRSSSMTAAELQKLEPSGFSVVSESLVSETIEGEVTLVRVQVDIPQVTYYGLVLPQSEINQAVRHRVDTWFSEFVRDAQPIPSDPLARYVYKIKGDVTYFSRHLLSVRLDIRQETPEKQQFLDNLVIGIASGNILQLGDIVKTDEAACQSLKTFVEEQLYYRGVASDAISFSCEQQPFVLDAVGITLFKLFPSENGVEPTVRVAFSEYPDFFLPEGPVGSIVY
jgi:hypothetical protein